MTDIDGHHSIGQNCSALQSIDVFPIIFDARGLRPDMLRFPRFSVWIYVFIQWRHSPNVNVITQTQGKRNMSGPSPLASNIIGKTSIIQPLLIYPKRHCWKHFTFWINLWWLKLPMYEVIIYCYNVNMSIPRKPAASRWRSGHAGAVNWNTAGAEMMTDRPCGWNQNVIQLT